MVIYRSATLLPRRGVELGPALTLTRDLAANQRRWLQSSSPLTREYAARGGLGARYLLTTKRKPRSRRARDRLPLVLARLLPHHRRLSPCPISHFPFRTRCPLPPFHKPALPYPPCLLCPPTAPAPSSTLVDPRTLPWLPPDSAALLAYSLSAVYTSSSPSNTAIKSRPARHPSAANKRRPFSGRNTPASVSPVLPPLSRPLALALAPLCVCCAARAVIAACHCPTTCARAPIPQEPAFLRVFARHQASRV